MNLYVYEDNRGIANCFGVIAVSDFSALAVLRKMDVDRDHVKRIAFLRLATNKSYKEGIAFMVEE